ncbi:hypothetical protein Tco_0973127 [Tanacetum coccineum]
MEVLNMILIKNIKEDSKFKYYYGCKELKLAHLRFVDDLLMLCIGDADSLKVMKKYLNEFSKNYWDSVYMIHNTVVLELEKLFRRSLWNSGESAKGKLKWHGAWFVVQVSRWFGNKASP